MIVCNFEDYKYRKIKPFLKKLRIAVVNYENRNGCLRSMAFCKYLPGY
jgi:hypothetical protein